MNALIIDSILIPFEDSINAQALQHESAMVDVYTKMKPDSFKSQLQAVLTAFYEDIEGVQGASGCPNCLPQDQDPQAQIRGPRGRRNNAARTRLASRTRAVPPPPRPQARQRLLPPPAGRSLQLRLRLLNLPPARRKGGGTGW